MQRFQPLVDQSNDRLQIEIFVFWGVSHEVGTGKPKQGGRGFQAVLLKVHKGSGKLNEGFKEIVIGTVPLLEPEIFQRIMCLIKLLAIEEIKIGIIRRARSARTGRVQETVDVLCLAQR